MVVHQQLLQEEVHVKVLAAQELQQELLVRVMLQEAQEVVDQICEERALQRDNPAFQAEHHLGDSIG